LFPSEVKFKHLRLSIYSHGFFGIKLCEWSSSPPYRFTTGRINIGSHSTGGCVDPRVGLEKSGEERNLCHCGELNPNFPCSSVCVV
jgi:hypothetical protein